MRCLGSIKAQFPIPRYLEVDVNILRLHREVRTSKPISDRGMAGWHCDLISPNAQ